LSLRQSLRRMVPLSLRQALAHQRRQLGDAVSGARFETGRVGDLGAYTCQVELTQRIMPSALFENKLANLKNGARLLSGSRIGPGEHWSFWKTVGEPIESNGFVVGRNLVDGVLTTQVGGGLCQPSSLMYHVALLAGLTVSERHPHSIDIYKEEDRFTPLGADATVVWGYKDLRLANPHDVEIVFECFVEGHTITARVHAKDDLPKYEVNFVRERLQPPMVRVDAVINGRVAVQTLYEQQQGMALSRSA
jgi:vancomycin resistance protein VanW